MFEQFEARDRETTEEIGRVLCRWRAPSPFRSYAEYQHALATAYEARVEFWNEVIEHVIQDASNFTVGVVLSAVLDARTGCEGHAREARREARQWAQWDQERAFRSYADNIAPVLGAVA